MRHVGILQALLSGFCFGFLGIFGKHAFAAGLRPGQFLALRFLLASFFLAGIFLFTPKRFFIERKALLCCFLLGTFGYAVFSSCFFLALEGLSASLTVLLLYTYPVIVSLGAWVFFREKLQIREWIALPLVLIGLMALVWGEFTVRSNFSLLIGLAAAFFYSLYILASSRWLKGIDPFTSTFYIMLSAAITLSAIHLRPSLFPLSTSLWLVLGGASLLSTLLAMALFLAAIQKLRNSEVSLLSTAEPITGVALATLLLGEQLQWQQLAGGAFVLVGMVLAAKKAQL